MIWGYMWPGRECPTYHRPEGTPETIKCFVRHGPRGARRHEKEWRPISLDRYWQNEESPFSMYGMYGSYKLPSYGHVGPARYAFAIVQLVYWRRGKGWRTAAWGGRIHYPSE